MYFINATKGFVLTVKKAITIVSKTVCRRSTSVGCFKISQQFFLLRNEWSDKLGCLYLVDFCIRLNLLHSVSFNQIAITLIPRNRRRSWGCPGVWTPQDLTNGVSCNGRTPQYLIWLNLIILPNHYQFIEICQKITFAQTPISKIFWGLSPKTPLQWGTTPPQISPSTSHLPLTLGTPLFQADRRPGRANISTYPHSEKMLTIFTYQINRIQAYTWISTGTHMNKYNDFPSVLWYCSLGNRMEAEQTLFTTYKCNRKMGNQ